MKKTSKKLKTFHVPITVTISGHETVQATDWQDAIKKARDQYHAQDFKIIDSYSHGVSDSCIDIDWAEDEEDVEVDDDGAA